jgi:hypothetical protein
MYELGGAPATGDKQTALARRERVWRALKWVRRFFAGLLIALAIAFLSAPSVTGWLLKREKARLRAEGEPTTVAEVVPRVPAGKRNAADVYQQAFRLLDLTRAEQEEFLTLKPAPRDRQWREQAESILHRNRAFLDRIQQASEIPDCAFPVDWTGLLDDATYPHYSSLRCAASLIGIRAAILASEGRGDQALASCQAMLRIAGQVDNEPSLIAQLVKWGTQGRSVRTAEEVMRATDVSPSACRLLRSSVASTDLRQSLVRALKGERAVSTDGTFRQFYERTLPMRGWARPLLLSAADLDAINYLRGMDEQTDAVWLRWPTSWSRARRAEAAAARRAMGRYGLGTIILLPAVARVIESSQRTQARLDGLNIALALKQYKAQRGAYPDSLAMLRSAGFDLPRDPFTGKQFAYRRQGAGFLVYSLGPDMDDDNGRDLPKDKRPKKSPAADGTALWDTDVPFRSTR